MTERTRAQESRAAIQQLYISMRHLFIRGGYKPLGVSGEAMIEALMVLQPEIYGNLSDPERVELEGLHYIFQRLPEGIEECRYIRLITKEGFEMSGFTPIVPPKRRRNCYRIDEEQMFVELTNGRSDIYDILTHLTFLYIEAEKVRRNALDPKGRKKRDWLNLEQVVELEKHGEPINREVACTYLSGLLGRTFEETLAAVKRFELTSRVSSLFHIVYWMGRLSIDEEQDKNDREITFSAALREKIGHHIFGSIWADNIKQFLHKKGWLDRPIHIISSNPHSVMNCLYAFGATRNKSSRGAMEHLAIELSHDENQELRQQVEEYAARHGMYQLDDHSGTNITVQIIDTQQVKPEGLAPEVKWNAALVATEKPLLLVIDYAFGEQAYEVMDELLKPFEIENGEQEIENGELKMENGAVTSPKSRIPLKVASISLMGKAGILEGGKGDIMVPTAHVFEGTADNYPFVNDFTKEDFEGNGLRVEAGTMITVLGTSLQNKDILRYFLRSSWRAVGLEMEGAHYQKAIQAASKIRKSISENVVLRYAYYASDNPLLTGHTLASGGLGEEGVKPTYLITLKILERIFSEK
ncbi:MAG: hypothetical protein K9J37_12455 [Saprospiraceae bacterium]|nr:hypothetical protein [Saprospiraceae bacterium]MCF8250722.1 hypothetical protein [Saprospiraceae bacterium]MCF8310516.1 hypothetical protein [Saprospiraceae bacterium]MCF8440852.1 hypothetical protein [Saprospiraceae bacterium]